MGNENKQYIVILDFETAEIYVSEYNGNTMNDEEEFFEAFNEEYGLELSTGNCQWMITRDQLNIKFL